MAWPRTAYLGPPEVGKGVIEKSDVALLLDILEHYRRRLQGLKNEFEAERKNEGFFLEDIDNEISSTINLVNHRRGMDTVELNGLTTEEENLIVRAIEVFVDDASRLKNDMKKDPPKVSIKSESLDRRISLAKTIMEKIGKKE